MSIREAEIKRYTDLLELYQNKINQLKKKEIEIMEELISLLKGEQSPIFKESKF